ncbi:hypothetical protein [Lysinibacillus sphaericus]|uniref:Uncharacterized protein n=1 Tax=Lysinibacillus sphaericus OT4b.31 TaxID=1285586 RepID=R7Z9L0_LYSSH|nr:hypothetical protein [Lysinibacillus sphaericus]EON70813.1 hypothetical protein H131_19592 [Lysinibacillus sphaericus OT4b.31]
MHQFVKKIDKSFDKVNKFFGVSIQRPEPSQKTIRIGSMLGTVLGIIVCIFGFIGGLKWSVIGGAFIALSNICNLLSMKK